MNRLELEVQKSLYKVINELKRAKNKDKIELLSNSAESLLEFITQEQLDVKIPKEYEFEISKAYDDINVKKYKSKLYSNIDDMLKYDFRLANIGDYFSKKYDIKNQKNNINTYLSDNEIIMLSLGFLDYYDKDIKDFFKNMANGERIILDRIDDSYDGLTYFSNAYINPYCIINHTNTILDVSTIIHEVIHAYIFEKTKYQTTKQKKQDDLNNLHETYSLFIELVVIEYLKQINFSKNDLNTLSTEYDIGLIDSLKGIYNILNNSDILDEELFYNYQLHTAYGYGKVLGYHFLDMYKQNKKATKDTLLRFMTESSMHDKIYMLSHYGLTLDKVTSKKTLKRYVGNHLN